MIKEHLTRFYLSANTPLGFVSRLNLLCDPNRFSHILLLKGGTRKRRAELINFAAETARAAKKDVHLVASVNSLNEPEAVYWKQFAIIDSAHPFAIEPRYPGLVEDVVWLGHCFDSKKLLARRDKIITLTEKEEQIREQSRRYLCAADALWNDNYRIALEATDVDKIESQADRIAANELKGSETYEEVCILSNGYRPLPELSAMDSIKTIVLIEDDYGPSSSLLLKALHKRAKDKKCHIICGYSPMAPFERLEQLIFPELSLAFLTTNERLTVECEPQRIINARRFTNKKILSSYKNRIAFNRKAARQMLSQYKLLQKNAQEVHEELENCYDLAFNEESFNQLCDQVKTLI